MRERHAVPLGHAHQAEVVGIGVARTFDQVRAQRRGVAREGVDGQSSGRAAEAAHIDGPRRRGKPRGNGGANEDVRRGCHEAIRRERREIREQPGIEPGTADHRSERRGARAIAVHGNQAEQLADGPLVASRKGHLLGECGRPPQQRDPAPGEPRGEHGPSIHVTALSYQTGPAHQTGQTQADRARLRGIIVGCS